MAALPLNTFKTVTKEVTTVEEVVYTAPVGVSTIFLMAQAANVGNQTLSVTFRHIRSGVKTEIVYNFSVPPNDSLSLLAGRLVLETADSVSIQASGNNGIKFLCSLLETSV